MGFIDEIRRGLEPPKATKPSTSFSVNPRSGFFEPNEKTIGMHIAEMEAHARSIQNAPKETPVVAPSVTRGFWEWVRK